jgi:hypothetical protein
VAKLCCPRALLKSGSAELPSYPPHPSMRCSGVQRGEALPTRPRPTHLEPLLLLCPVAATPARGALTCGAVAGMAYAKSLKCGAAPPEAMMWIRRVASAALKTRRGGATHVRRHGGRHREMSQAFYEKGAWSTHLDRRHTASRHRRRRPRHRQAAHLEW